MDIIDLNTILNLLGDPSINEITSNQSTSIEVPEKIELVEVNGKIVDSTTNEPIKGVNVVNFLKNTIKTDKNGDFKIKVPNLFNTSLNPTKFEINILGKKGEYSSYKIIPYTSTNDVKINLGIIPLQPLQSDLNQEINELLTYKDSQVEKYVTSEITFEFFVQKQLNLSINDLKKTVLPLILGMVARYGLTKIQELIIEVKNNGGELTENIKQQISCPTQSNIAGIIATKNKLTYQLNNTLNKINAVSQTLQISDTTIQTIDTIYQILKNLPTPSAIGGVGIPISIINNVQDVKTFLSNNISKLKKGNSSLSNILSLLVEILTQVLSFLSFLDKITQFCSEGEIDQTLISQELTLLTQQQSNQLSPVVTNVNGFEMGVESEITSQPLKRRRAIARNKQGIIMLKGEWSFSSIDQILIDELVFYIQQNDLKAN